MMMGIGTPMSQSRTERIVNFLRGYGDVGSQASRCLPPMVAAKAAQNAAVSSETNRCRLRLRLLLRSQRWLHSL